MAVVMDWSEPITKEFLEKMVEGGSARIRVIENTDDYLAGMVPAGMARKQRIRAMEKTAGDKGLTDTVRQKAWDDAGKLKAVEKQAARNRYKLIEGSKEAAKAIQTWQKRGGRD